MKLAILVLVIGMLFAITSLLGRTHRSAPTEVMEAMEVIPDIVPTSTPLPSPTTLIIRSVLHTVPFTSQAPYGEWNDKRFQDACEEASVLMVYCVFHDDKCSMTNGVLDKAFVKNQIEMMAEFQSQQYGGYVDTSIFDTKMRLWVEFFGIERSNIADLGSTQELIDLLVEGNVVIVPTNGKLLYNPNFTHGGPDRHNLVVIGYDKETQEFITNDPGTRKGKGYRYAEDVLFAAIRDYPTGDHEEISMVRKTVLVIPFD